MPDIDPRKVTLARESRGLTQGQLAELLGMSQAKVSRVEAGVLGISDEMLSRIAATLNYRESFFLERDELYGIDTSLIYHRAFETSVMYHRKQATMPARVLRQVHATINVRRIHVERLLLAADFEASKPFPRLDIDEHESPEAVAKLVRAAWLLPMGPVENVTKAIEDAGGIVIKMDYETRKLDAVSQWIPGRPPMFFVNRSLPGDRLRLSLAHELGHVVMHRVVNADIEHQAFRFAAEFLMPRDQIRHNLSIVSPARLATLKPHWRVSMQALLKRAEDIGAITPRHARDVWMHLGQAGYRLREPAELDVPTEEPRLLRELIDLHAKRLGYSVDDLSRLLGIYEPEVKSIYFPAPSGLRAIPGGRRPGGLMDGLSRN